ncbi:hypothetical protein N7522_006347 [Penicillium canescens]|nr:hypothetical protein N7522_006347 [Penicillium canescens]
MYRRQSPSGRLPRTVAKKETDYGPLLSQAVPVGETNAYCPQADFSEGILIGYKAFDEAGNPPRYEFSYEVTYTAFDYFNLRVTAQKNRAGHISALAQVSTRATYPHFGTWSPQLDYWKDRGPWLQPRYPSFTSGSLEGQSRFYVASPRKRGGVGFELTRRDHSVWDVEAQN